MNKKYLNVVFTKHALNRLYNRGITQQDIWYTFQHPDNITSGKISGSKMFSKNYGKQTIFVIAKKNNQGQWIILSCWSKYVGDSNPISPPMFFLENLIMKVLDKFR